LILFWMLLSGLAWTPLLFGSQRALAWGINAIFFAGVTLVYEFGILATRRQHPVAFGNVAFSGVSFVVVVMWILVQNATWTPTNLHHQIWQMAADILETRLDGSISVNRNLTSLSLTQLLTAASLFWLTLQLCRDAGRAVLLMNAVGFIVSAYAAYGLVALLVSPGQVLWLPNPAEQGFVTSTFINRNTFATFAGIGFVVNCGLIFAQLDPAQTAAGGSVRHGIAHLIEIGQRLTLLLGSALLNLVALLLTGSRGGTIGAMLGFIVLASLMLGRRGYVSSVVLRTRVVFATLVIVLVAIVSVTLGDAVTNSLLTRGFYDESRIAVDFVVWQSILNKPLLGHGFGTFVDVFPLFRDRTVDGFYTLGAAHNAYVEVLQGLGLMFGSMLLACVTLLAVRCLRGAVNRHRDIAVPCIAEGVCVVVAVHAVVDYSLQIQAITLTFVGILACGVAQCQSSRRDLGD
jgi:hypothetical protein